MHYLASCFLIKKILEALKVSETKEKELIKKQDFNIAPFLSVILYLCSVSADIADLRGKRKKPGNPRPTKTKKGMRTFPTDGHTTWLVGYRIGATLRLADSEKETEREKSAGEKSHASPRPHVRRAHWHSYWTGPRKEPEKQKLILKWIPPVLVGVEDIVPTVRRVE